MIQHIDIWCPEEDNLTNGAGNVQEKKIQDNVSNIERIKLQINRHKMLDIKLYSRKAIEHQG